MPTNYMICSLNFWSKILDFIWRYLGNYELEIKELEIRRIEKMTSLERAIQESKEREENRVENTLSYVNGRLKWEPKWREMVELSLSTFLVLKIQYELNKSETGCRKEGELINLTLSHLERLAKEGLGEK